jgi:hypothetical protein
MDVSGSMTTSKKYIAKSFFFWMVRFLGYLLKVGQLEYDCCYSKMHGMPVTGGRSLEA